MKKIIKIVVFMLIIIVGYLLNKMYGISDLVVDSSNWEAVARFVNNNHVLTVVLYQIFTILGASVLAIPGVTFAIVSTGLFGPWLGSFYCLIGTTIGALMSFLLSKYLLKETVKPLVKKNEGLYNIIYNIEADKEMLVLMITRLLPIFPFNLQNFAYGITNISTVKYALGTFLFMIPGITLFSVGTEGIINKDNREIMFLIAIIILLLTIAVSILLYKKYKLLVIEGNDER